MIVLYPESYCTSNEQCNKEVCIYVFSAVAPEYNAINQGMEVS